MADYYVNASGGNDSNGGTHPTTDAKLTPQAGVNLLAAGDTLWIEAGTYSSGTTITVDDSRGGSSFQTATTIRGRNGIPVLTSATNSVNIITTDTGTTTYFLMQDIKITHTASTRGNGVHGAGANLPSSIWKLLNVEIDGCAIGINDGNRVAFPWLEQVTVRNSTSHGASLGIFPTGLNKCSFLNNSGNGLLINTSVNTGIFMARRCVFAGNGIAGFAYDAFQRIVIPLSFYSCTFSGNTSHGLNLPVGSTGSILPALCDNVFYGNGGYGVVTGTLGAGAGGINRNNAYGSNTSGSHSGWFDGTNKITLTANPFTNPAGEDWSPNLTSGGGALLRFAGLGGGDIGAIQHQSAAGLAGKIVGSPFIRRV